MTRLVLLLAIVACGTHSPPSPAALALPADSFFVADVLGANKLDVDRLLGSATVAADGEVHYDRFARVPIAILFDNDRAARIRAAPAGYAPSDANAAAVLAWMHADPAQLVVDASTIIDVWAPAMHARQLQRAVFAAQLEPILAPSRAFAAAAGTQIAIYGPCTEPVLLDLVGRSRAALVRLGVAQLACAGGASLPVR